MSRLQQKGHGVHQCVDGHIKVYPPIPYVRNIYHEHFRRAAEEQKRNPVAKPKDLGQLCRLAKIRTANKVPVRKIGRNVVDIDLEQSVGNGNYKLLSLGIYIQREGSSACENGAFWSSESASCEERGTASA